VAAKLVATPLDLDVLASWSPSRWWPRWSPSSNHRTLATGDPTRPGALVLAADPGDDDAGGAPLDLDASDRLLPDLKLRPVQNSAD
jgi:hypothetical protein